MKESSSSYDLASLKYHLQLMNEPNKRHSLKAVTNNTVYKFAPIIALCYAGMNLYTFMYVFNFWN